MVERELLVKSIEEEQSIWRGCISDGFTIVPGVCQAESKDCDGYRVGLEGDPHCLVVGGSGTGKTSYLQYLIANLTRKYAPSELVLYVADPAGFSNLKYRIDEGVSLPHLECNAMDAEETLRMVEELYTIARLRYDTYKYAGVFNIHEFKEKTHKHQPYIVCVIDELQQMYRESAKIVEEFDRYLTYLLKVGRAVGIVVIGSVRCIDNLIPKGVLHMLSLHMVFKHDKETVLEVLGKDVEWQETESVGFMYTKSGLSESDITFWRVPYISPEVRREDIKYLHEAANTLSVDRGFVTTDIYLKE